MYQGKKALIYDNLKDAEIAKRILNKFKIWADIELTREEYRQAKYEDVSWKERFRAEHPRSLKPAPALTRGPRTYSLHKATFGPDEPINKDIIGPANYYRLFPEQKESLSTVVST